MKILRLFIIALPLLALSACNDWLSKEPLATQKLDDYFVNDTAATSAVNAVYVPAQWQLGGTYFNEWFIGDVVSDDALKGGLTLSDMQTAGLMENFEVTANNELLKAFYNANFQGIYRANFAIERINMMDKELLKNDKLRARLIGESTFLRAYYYFRLARVFGGVPYVDRVLNQNDALMPRATKAQIMDLIKSDLRTAVTNLWEKNEYPIDDLGRATKGAARAMLMRVLLFDISNSANPDKDYREVMQLGTDMETSNQYDLYANYGEIFKTSTANPSATARLVEENGIESVFEIQYMEEATSDYGGLGLARGSFNPIMTRTRSGNKGWGFNRPSQDLYDAYETGDPRRDETILPYDAGDVYGKNEGINNGYHNRKTAMAVPRPGGLFVYPGLAHDTRASLNTMVIRYADVLLMYAEAACAVNETGLAKIALNRVRERARNSSSDPSTLLKDFPYGNYSDNATDLRDAIRHERRVELGMEGHRWYDLVRWGIAGDVMNDYRQKYIQQEGQFMNPFKKGIHELFPIPETEINSNPKLTQNPGY